MKKIKYIMLIIIALLFVTNCNRVKVDKSLMEAFKATTQNCKVDLKYGFIKDCKNNEDKTIKTIVKSKPLSETLGTIAVAMNSDDKKLVAVACETAYGMYGNYFYKMSKNPELIKKNVVEKLLEGLKKNKSYIMFYCASTVANAAVIKGGYDKELLAIADSQTQDNRHIQGEIYLHGLKYGRMRFANVYKKLMESNDKKNKIWAVGALRNIYNYSEKEKKQVCPWISKYIDDKDSYVARYAAYISSGLCQGKYIDMVLDTAEKRQKDGTLDKWYVLDATPFSCPDSLMGKVFRDKRANAERCKRRAALRKAVDLK